MSLVSLVLAGCATSSPPLPPQVAVEVPPPPAVIDRPLTLAARQQAEQTFPGKRLKPGQFAWVPAAAIPKVGKVEVLISMRDQSGYIFKGDTLIGITTASTGTKDHPTDPGRWTILSKKIFHRSNKYSNAPMPHMQVLDKYGRALHGGVVPGYPASHGCIRLPPLLAKRLYTMTKVGDVVNIEA